jgi:transketolase
VIFDEGHRFSLHRAQVLRSGGEVALVANGMMFSAALAAAEALAGAGVGATVVNVPVIKPLDAATVLEVAAATTGVVTAENHTVIGGLGTAVAEVLAEAGLGRRLARVGLQDTFAEGSRVSPPLFAKYHLGTQDVVAAAWSVLGRTDSPPAARAVPAAEGEYAPV